MLYLILKLYRISFNTQPPEGGWKRKLPCSYTLYMFQHTAARRRLEIAETIKGLRKLVSTHSRPKAAGGIVYCPYNNNKRVSTHSGPKAAGECQTIYLTRVNDVSTHSRPKAAGTINIMLIVCLPVSTHSRPKAAGNAGAL